MLKTVGHILIHYFPFTMCAGMLGYLIMSLIKFFVVMEHFTSGCVYAAHLRAMAGAYVNTMYIPDFLLIQNILFNSWGLPISDQRYIGKNAKVPSFFCTLLKVLLAAALNIA